MDTSPLKTFATAARVQLLREVSARLSVVLAPSSIARVEALGAVNALERAIAREGGSDIGQKAIIDQVAYMWFNRVIALRFMDANGYTGIGVVSPDESFPNAQPEILTQAKLGQIDSDVLDAKLLARVSGILNGTIRSEDSQNEAYGILLMAYCRHWNRSMPFMFEKEGDFTELLIPANLLSDESVMAKALKTLTSEVCNDVEVIGWLYQFYIAERKDEVFVGFKNNQKAGPAEIPAATQLFTPDWIVRYLVENSLGRLWLLNHPDSKLATQMEFYISPIEIESDFLQISTPKELKVVDPACGSGHMLTYAFDLLYAIYEEEGYSPAEIPILILENNLYGIEIDPRAGALAAFALAMKARAKQRTFFTQEVAPNICVLEPIRFIPDELTELMTRQGHRLEEEDFLNQFEDADTFGSLIIPNEYVSTELENHLRTIDVDTLHGQDLYDRAKRVIEQAEYLSRRYNVVVANPPYMGSGNMGRKLSEFAKQNYPNGKSDLFAMFIERNLILVVPQGFVAMITMHSWMFLSSYEKFRGDLLRRHALVSMAHLGARAFDSIGGEVVATTAFVVEAGRNDIVAGTFVRLVDGRSEIEKLRALREAVVEMECLWRYESSDNDFRQIPGSPIAYWLTPQVRLAFDSGRLLRDWATPRQGLATGNNDRFLRLWHEVASNSTGMGLASRAEADLSGRRWFPLQKGGSYRKWFGNHDYVVDWKNDGQEIRDFVDEAGRQRSRPQNMDYYFREGITWSTISTGNLSMRYSPRGAISNAKGAMCFAEERTSLLWVLAFANTKVVNELLSAISPTLDFSEGPVGKLPLLGMPDPDAIFEIERCVAIAREDWDSSELSYDFLRYQLMNRIDSKESLESACKRVWVHWTSLSEELRLLEERNNERFIEIYGLVEQVSKAVTIGDITLRNRVSVTSPDIEFRAEQILSLISYAVGCMFGRYSLDKLGIILANQNDSLKEYLEQVPNPLFMPDKDNVIPLMDGEWFEDDIVIRFRRFLRIAFGDEHFEKNLRFIEQTLGKDIRKYFVTDFYKDHVQRYKKRPIYWLLSSKQGSFNALIYMHRYNPSTPSIVLNEYLREFEAKLRTELVNQERISASSANPRDRARADKETDRIRKVLLELNEYEHDVLYPLATQQLTIDLDDGVKVNYSKFGSALKSIPGLGASDE